MKKLIVFAVLTVFGLTAMNAQGQFKIGIAGGLPIGDSSDLAIFSIAVDLGYLFEVSESFDVGPITGYSHTFGDDHTVGPFTVEGKDVSFIPVGVGGRFYASDNFVLGIDTGYSIGLTDGIDGGFYYAPRVQYETGQNVAIVASYRGTSLDGGSWDIITLGVEFGLN